MDASTSQTANSVWTTTNKANVFEILVRNLISETVVFCYQKDVYVLLLTFEEFQELRK